MLGRERRSVHSWSLARGDCEGSGEQIVYWRRLKRRRAALPASVQKVQTSTGLSIMLPPPSP